MATTSRRRRRSCPGHRRAENEAAPEISLRGRRSFRAPEEGFEPPTRRLTAACSTPELLRNEVADRCHPRRAPVKPPGAPCCGSGRRPAGGPPHVSAETFPRGGPTDRPRLRGDVPGLDVPRPAAPRLRGDVPGAPTDDPPRIPAETPREAPTAPRLRGDVPGAAPRLRGDVTEAGSPHRGGPELCVHRGPRGGAHDAPGAARRGRRPCPAPAPVSGPRTRPRGRRCRACSWSSGRRTRARGRPGRGWRGAPPCGWGRSARTGRTGP